MGHLGEEGELIETIQQLSLTRSVETIQAIVRHTARRLTGAVAATFVLRDGDLCHYADEDAIEPLWKGQRFPMSACISGWVMRHRRAVMLPDIYADDRIPADACRPTFVKSLLMVPIRRLDPIGAIGTYWAEHYEPSDREMMLLQALADSTAMAMENVRMIDELEAARRDSLMRLVLMQPAEQIALTHHERWDGSGYPNAMAGDDIPITGRIVAMADVFDALTHPRPYKAAWSIDATVSEIRSLESRQFDPMVVSAFMELDPTALIELPADAPVL
jgi:hypothetical protein